MTDKAIARYDGPRTTDELREYALALAFDTDPEGHYKRNDALPVAFRGNPGAVAFVTEYGKALDVSPVTAMIGIHFVDGKPTASAGLISALIRRAGHELRVKLTGTYEAADLQAVATIKRHDDPTFEYESVWTMQRAIRANLLKKTADGRIVASKDRSAWATYPENMLKARAITEVGRDAAEDALLGVHYTAEEVGAETDETGAPVTMTAEQIPTERPATRPEPTPAEDRRGAQVDVETAAAGFGTDPELADRVRTAILDADSTDALSAVWRDPDGIAGYRDAAAVLILADERGLECSALDLFTRAGNELRDHGRKLTDPDPTPAAEQTVQGEVVEPAAEPTAEAADEPADVVEAVVVDPPAADETPAEPTAELVLAEILELPHDRAQRALETLLAAMRNEAQAQVKAWAGGKGLNPGHSVGNVHAVVSAIGLGDPDLALPASPQLLVDVLGAVVGWREREASEARASKAESSAAARAAARAARPS